MGTAEELIIKKNMMYHILLKNLGSDTYYKTGELHEKIYNAMQEYAKQYQGGCTKEQLEKAFDAGRELGWWNSTEDPNPKEAPNYKYFEEWIEKTNI